MSVGQRSLVPASTPAPAPAPKRRRLDLSAAVGGVDDGVEDEEEAGRGAAAATAASPAAAAAATAPAASMITKLDSAVTYRTAEWYYLSPQGQYQGPFTADDLKDKYEGGGEGAPGTAGAVHSGTVVWAQGCVPEWMPIERVPELYEYLEKEEEAAVDTKTATEEDAEADAAAKAKRKRERKERAQKPKEGKDGWFEMKVVTSIYVSLLPEGTTAEDLGDFFSKAGVFKIDPLTKQPKVRVYKNNDGLVTFAKRPSVDLSLQIYDGASFTNAAGNTSTISVEEAKFEQKGRSYTPRTDLEALEAAAKKAKKAAAGKLGWNEGEDDPNDRTVVVKHVFSAAALDKDPTMTSGLRADLKAYAETIGAVENIKILGFTEEGIVLVCSLFVCLP